MSNYKPMSEKWLHENQRCMIQFSEGWTFHIVTAVFSTKFENYGTSFAGIAKAGTSDDVELKDKNGDYIFDVTQNKASEYFYHVGIGIKPSYIDVFVKYGSGNYRGEWFNLTTITTNSIYGGVDGNDSPYNRPTDAMEFIFPFGITARFGFRNKEYILKKAKPIFNILMKQYQIRTLDKLIPEDRQLMYKMATGYKAKSRLLTMGVPGSLLAYGKLKEYWKVDPITIPEAMALGGAENAK